MFFCCRYNYEYKKKLNKYLREPYNKRDFLLLFLTLDIITEYLESELDEKSGESKTIVVQLN